MGPLVAIASHRRGLLLEISKEKIIAQHISFLGLTYLIIPLNQTNSTRLTYLRQATTRIAFWLWITRSSRILPSRWNRVCNSTRVRSRTSKHSRLCGTARTSLSALMPGTSASPIRRCLLRSRGTNTMLAGLMLHPSTSKWTSHLWQSRGIRSRRTVPWYLPWPRRDSLSAGGNTLLHKLQFRTISKVSLRAGSTGLAALKTSCRPQNTRKRKAVWLPAKTPG